MTDDTARDNAPARSGDVVSPALGELLASLRMLFDHVRVVVVEVPPDGWMTGTELLRPHDAPLAPLLERIGQRYEDSRGQAAALSFMLRFGWSAGPMIAAYLGLGCRLRYRDCSLRFASTTALEAVCIRHSELVESSADADAARRGLLDDLIAHTEAVLQAQHLASGVERQALWSMATSTWGAQFIEVAERLGDAEGGKREADALFALLPPIRDAAPRLFGVASGGRHGVCQVRGACCLNHRVPGGQRCMVCPLISEGERAQRNREWLDRRPRVRKLDPAVAAMLRRRTALGLQRASA